MAEALNSSFAPSDRRKFIKGAMSTAAMFGVLGATVLAEQADPVFGLIHRHRVACAETQMTCSTGAEWEAIVDAEDDLMHELAETVPQSLAGLRAFVEHFHDLVSRDGELFEIECAFPSIVEACLNLIPAS